jgi:hypothetical protein
MSIEEYHQLSYKFVAQKPALSPTIQVNIKLDIKAYKAHSPPLKIMMTREFAKKLTTRTTINPDPRGTGDHTGQQPFEQDRPEHIMLTPHSSSAGLRKCLRHLGHGRLLVVYQGQVSADR